MIEDEYMLQRDRKKQKSRKQKAELVSEI